MIFKNNSKDLPINQDISKLELNQRKNNIINKIYFSPEINNKVNSYTNQNNIQNYNKTKIINNNNCINNNVNLNINQSQINNVEISQSQREEQNIKEMIRNQFVRKVYGILLVQFLMTFGFILICQIKVIKNFLYIHISLYISLMTISGISFLISFIIFMCCPNFLRKVPHNYIFLFIFTISETILLIYISILYSFEYVLGAIILVIGICGVIFFISCIKKISLKFIYLFLIIAVILGLIYGILAIIFRNYYLEFLFCLIGAIIFTLFLVYDTQTITRLDNNYLTVDDYIFAAIILYTDIIRVFIQILKILGRFYGGRETNNK